MKKSLRKSREHRPARNWQNLAHINVGKIVTINKHSYETLIDGTYATVEYWESYYEGDDEVDLFPDLEVDLEFN